MGRPLYSKSHSAPPVRIETPAEAQPCYVRWSERRFDPDADAFFEADDAVYEAFLSPEDALAPAVATALTMAADAQQAPASEDRGEDSSEESDDGASVRTPGREIPMATAGTGARVIQEYHRYLRYLRESQLTRLSQASAPTPSMSFATFEQDFGRWLGANIEAPMSSSAAPLSAHRPQLGPESTVDASLSASSGFTHAPLVTQRPSTPPAVPSPPVAVTPSPVRVSLTSAPPTPQFLASPSPAPVSTPRIYSWRSVGGTGGARVIPPPTSPSVHRSLAHVSSPMLRRPDVIV